MGHAAVQQLVQCIKCESHCNIELEGNKENTPNIMKDYNTFKQAFLKACNSKTNKVAKDKEE